jgi:methylated-DNA-protein-cysteine methyltransferase related protein
MLTRMPNTPDRSRPARSRSAPNPNPAEAILAAIRAVPRGQVAGYGMIARRAGLPGRARLVARVLGQNDDCALPWHRILRSDGRIAFPPESPGFAEQVARLRAEGVDVSNGRVRRAASDHLAEGGLDAEVWSPR